MMVKTSYERVNRKTQAKRAFGYGFLWPFLGLFIYWIGSINSYTYPMYQELALLLVIIGVWRLVVGLKVYQQKQAEAWR